MKKVGIITIYDENNFGNRLQNYAVQELIKKYLETDVVTIIENQSKKETLKKNFKNFIKMFCSIFIKKYRKETLKFLKKICHPIKTRRKLEHFKEFNNNINTYFITYLSNNLKSEFSLFIVGSDQVWNPNFWGHGNYDFNKYLLTFADDIQKNSISASFGINNLSNDMINKLKEPLSQFNAISVRESRGKELIEEITSRTDVQVLLDPTMLLELKVWNKIEKKPRIIKEHQKYILNYFLGNNTYNETIKNEIKRIANENNCIIINILDINDPFYSCGPSEFLWLEKNAFLVCTDSFHSSVFAILYNTPFIVFEREEKYKKANKTSMNSRIETLLSKFDLQDRYYKSGKKLEDLLDVNYKSKDKILNYEREKARAFFNKML